MAESGSVVHHPLVHVRGGATMLLTALFGSLPPPAQTALRRLLLLIPVTGLAKMQRVAAQEFAKRVLLPLLTGVLPSSVAQACASVKLPRSSAALLSTLSSAMVLYSAGAKLFKADQRACAAFNPAALAALPSEEELLRCLISAVAGVAAAVPPAAQRRVIPSAPSPPPRMCDVLFSTTTPVALKAYLRHTQGHSRASALTVYVPGLLTAPWTTHLVPLLCNAAARRHGTIVVGYDVVLCDAGYDVDLPHLRKVSQSHRHGEDSSSSKRNATKVTDVLASRAAASAAAQAFVPTTGVLVLASIRGRRVRNADEACVWAKMQGWAVVELCVPTVPPAALDALAPPPLQPQWMRDRQARCGGAALVRPDLRVTAFDDAGMYGGAVVEVCTSDASLRLHMQRECQPGLAEGRDDAASARCNAAPAPRTVHSLVPAAVASAADAAARSNEFLATVWGPWTQRLCVAAWREADVLHQGSVLAQEAWTALRRFPTQTLPSLPAHAAAQLHRLASLRLFQAGSGAGGGQDDAVPTASADTPLEQRTTYITGPLAPLATSGLGPPVRPPASRGTRTAAGPAVTRETAVAAAKAALPSVPEQALTNSPVEWRIRLRWSSLLLSPAIASAATPSLSPSSPTTTATAAYLSVWSFVAQLPPWVVAVSVAGDDGNDHGAATPYSLLRSAACVEASATALLVRVAFPASPRAAAELLREEAHVEAAAVRSQMWTAQPADAGARVAPSAGAESFAFADVVIFPGCAKAARLGEELLYLPLSPELPVHVRAAMLRVLWDKVPHAEDAAHAGLVQRRGSPASLSPHVQATLNHIYRTTLPHARLPRGDDSGMRALAVGGAAAVAGQDAERVQRYFFDCAAAVSASSLAPLTAAKSLAQTLLLTTMSSL